MKVTVLIKISLVLLVLSLLLSNVDAKKKTKKNKSKKNKSKKEKKPLDLKSMAIGLHQQAIAVATKGDYKGALPDFRAAVRLSPNNLGFLNDLGVTEMRVGEYQKAKRRFLKALELDPNFDTAKENIVELKKFVNEEEFQLGVGDFPQLHTLSEPPEIDAKEFLKLTIDDDANNPGIMGDAPIVIRGAAQAWGWDFEKMNLDLMKSKKYGNKQADYYPHNMLEETVHPIFFNLKEAIEQLSMPQSGYMDMDTSLPGTYIQWNVDEEAWRGMLDDMSATLPAVFEDKHWTDKCFDAEGVTKFNKNIHWKMMLIGEEDAGMFNHKDVMRMASWQVQMTGSKRWHICSPTQDKYVGAAGQVDMFKPDYARFPKMINATCYQTITRKGDAMYYPRDWWHQTRNLETPSVAFSGSMINKHCHKEFAVEMRRNCNSDQGGNVFQPEPAFCKQVEKCIKNWRKMYKDKGEAQVEPNPRGIHQEPLGLRKIQQVEEVEDDDDDEEDDDEDDDDDDDDEDNEEDEEDEDDEEDEEDEDDEL